MPAKEREMTLARDKALHVNLDPTKYGTVVEIGAGQEVARWFFRVGGASGTVAKTMSAYDMTVSDAIYGKAPRYVSRQRLEKMLDHEFTLLQQRLNEERGENTHFFVFADTVRAKSYRGGGECHGWLGVRFQSEPHAEPSQIIVHVRMLDNENIQQQEALGIIGVNLIYGAFYKHDDSEALIRSLLDNLSLKRVEIDMLKMTGPVFSTIDSRLVALQLVELGLSNAAMFRSNGEVIQPAEELYKKSVLVERGSFRPVTNVTIDMLEAAASQFIQEPKVDADNVVVLFEMTLKNLSGEGGIDHRDFLDRADVLAALGKNVLISNYGAFHRLAAYLFRYTEKMSGIAMGVPTLKEIFEPKYYTDLAGGILESFGRLFKHDLKLYVYPMKGAITGSMITAGNLRVAPNLRHLYAYLLENQFIQGLRDINEEYLPIFSRDVLRKIKDGDDSWEKAVPEAVSKIIKEREFFGYKNTSIPASRNGHAKKQVASKKTTARAKQIR